MISFRYHVVTIVAVFLALAIGLLGGAAFVQPALQEELQRQTDSGATSPTGLSRSGTCANRSGRSAVSRRPPCRT